MGHDNAYCGDNSSVFPCAIHTRSFMTSVAATAQQLPHFPWSLTVPINPLHSAHSFLASKCLGKPNDSGSNEALMSRLYSSVFVLCPQFPSSGVIIEYGMYSFEYRSSSSMEANSDFKIICGSCCCPPIKPPDFTFEIG